MGINNPLQTLALPCRYNSLPLMGIGHRRRRGSYAPTPAAPLHTLALPCTSNVHRAHSRVNRFYTGLTIFFFKRRLARVSRVGRVARDGSRSQHYPSPMSIDSYGSVPCRVHTVVKLLHWLIYQNTSSVFIPSVKRKLLRSSNW